MANEILEQELVNVMNKLVEKAVRHYETLKTFIEQNHPDIDLEVLEAEMRKKNKKRES